MVMAAELDSRGHTALYFYTERKKGTIGTISENLRLTV
jgi:hypothetical protein